MNEWIMITFDKLLTSLFYIENRTARSTAYRMSGEEKTTNSRYYEYVVEDHAKAFSLT
jgi:hypothetical protein